MPEETREEAAERIAKEHGILPEILKGWGVDVEDMETLAKIVAGEKIKAVDEAVQEAVNFVEESGLESEDEGINEEVLEEANRAFNDGKITANELAEVVKAFEAQAQESQNPDPLEKAIEDFQAGVITEKELRAAKRKADGEGLESEDEDILARANADFAAGIIDEAELRAIVQEQETTEYLGSEEWRARKAKLAEEKAESENA